MMRKSHTLTEEARDARPAFRQTEKGTILMVDALVVTRSIRGTQNFN